MEVLPRRFVLARMMAVGRHSPVGSRRLALAADG